MEASSIVSPPRAHHHVLGVELAGTQSPGVMGRRSETVGRGRRHLSVAAASMPTALVRRPEVAAGGGGVLGHGTVTGHVDRRLLEVLVEA